MRLESHQNPTSGESSTHGFKRCFHFMRMVTVVINESEVAALRQSNLSVAAEAPPHTGKVFKSRLDTFIGDIDHRCDGNRRKTVSDIVHAGQIQANIQRFASLS